MLALFACRVIFHADFFQYLLFQKILPETLSECRTVMFQIKADVEFHGK